MFIYWINFTTEYSTILRKAIIIAENDSDMETLLYNKIKEDLNTYVDEYAITRMALAKSKVVYMES